MVEVYDVRNPPFSAAHDVFKDLHSVECLEKMHFP